ncbi:MAG: triose-phosphate isomerase [Pseudomonadales bacterium]|nr:triose-phosphate isomerase [Pseudomonadales bacterium]
MVKPLVAGNWKMNGSRVFAEELVIGLLEHSSSLSKADVVICPPSIYLHQLWQKLSGQNENPIQLGAQNVGAQDEGAYTGEISSGMLSEFDCAYVLVGHSERRALFAETDSQVADKFQAVQRYGMTPVLCIGESLEQRESGQTFKVLAEQLKPLLQFPIEVWRNAVIAYEPVWAIGTGQTASPEQAQEVHAWLRNLLKDQVGRLADDIRLLYGGSVKPDNAKMLFAQQDINGFLVGGASLKLQDFLAICRVAE